MLYLDPPYPQVASYERTYRFVDLLLEGDCHEVSAFSGTTPPLEELLAAASHIPIWAMSMGNSLMGKQEVEELLARHRRHVTGLAIPYRHLPSLASRDKSKQNREFVFVAWDHVP